MSKQPGSSPLNVALFFLLAVVGCGLDLATKHLVFASSSLFHGSEWWLIPGHIGIQKSLNEGALFGMGQGKVWFFAAVAGLAAVAIVVWVVRFRAADDRWLAVTLGCILGGILGNLYDRTGLPGLFWDNFDPRRMGEPVFAVRDWILFQINERLVWPNFNVADSLLVVGACLLVLRSITIQPSEEVGG
jgi:signal peptidase II